MTDSKQTFARKVWDTLSRKDILPYIEYLPKTAKRPAIPYLSWVNAWTMLKQEFPQSEFVYLDDKHLINESVEVGCMVHVQEGSHCVSQSMRLAVMDNHFNAVISPNARDLADTRQRCLVKAIAMHGLGLSLWTKDSQLMPVGEGGEPIADSKTSKGELRTDILKRLIEGAKVNVEDILQWANADNLEEISLVSYKWARNMLLARIEEHKHADS